MRDLFTEASHAVPVDVTSDRIETMLAFVRARIDGALREAGLAHDVVAAALAARGHNPARARLVAEQLAAWIARDDWSLLLDTYARCVRITRDQPALDLSPDLLQEEAERELYTALRVAESHISPDGDVNALMAAFVPLVPHIRRFFDDVLVMAKDEDLRRARLALLERIAGLAEGIVDLSKLEGF